jgi:hypothetical protein
MRASDLRLGHTYDCIIDGNRGRDMARIVPLAADTEKRRQFVIVEPKRLLREAPAFFKRLLAMSYREIVEEDLDGCLDKGLSAHVWNMEITETGDLHNEDFDAYFVDIVEVAPPAAESARG